MATVPPAPPSRDARFVPGGDADRARRSPEPSGAFSADIALAQLAARQLGLVTLRQAVDAGVSRSALDRRRQAGVWATVFPAVLRSTAVPPTVEQTILAAALAVPGSTVVGPSAAVVDGFPIGRPGLPTVAIRPGRSARVSGVRTLRLAQPLPSYAWHTVRRSTPAAIVVALARFVDAATLERCLDHGLAHRLTTVDEVRRLLDHLPARAVPGRRLLLGLLDARGDQVGHRSGLEQRVAGWLDAAGLTGWRANHRVPVSGGTLECDFVWLDQATVLEVSPFVTHGSRATQERDAERRRLLVAAGWRVVEATDADLVGRQSFDRCVMALRCLLRS